jgi:SAM-dependent methyltransferase
MDTAPNPRILHDHCDSPNDVLRHGDCVVQQAAAGLPNEACPVCGARLADPFLVASQRQCWQCARCWAVFVAPAQRPSPEAEASYYALHQNQVDDPGYRRFLAGLTGPLLERVPPASHGLDFGCGPGPALAHMLREAGHRMTVYDPLFFPDDVALAARYDFITLSEVAEHLHDPAAEFARLFGLLRPGGLLAVMTGFVPPVSGFERWHYHRDPTHVVFYRPSTFRFLAMRHDADCEIPCPNVALLRRRR